VYSIVQNRTEDLNFKKSEKSSDGMKLFFVLLCIVPKNKCMLTANSTMRASTMLPTTVIKSNVFQASLK
jgi:hypothetical protein